MLPFIGYFIGWLVAILFKQNYEDRLAIAVEAGIQNTGIAIFVLRFALPQPEADLTTVVPVAVAIMTPFPLMAYYLCYKGRELYVYFFFFLIQLSRFVHPIAGTRRFNAVIRCRLLITFQFVTLFIYSVRKYRTRNYPIETKTSLTQRTSLS